MLGKRKRLKREDAELDITSFMNLMIVLVPVLLMMMVFSRITVIELKLPGIEALADDQPIEQQALEVLIGDKGMAVYFPQGYLVQSLPLVAEQDTGNYQQDFEGLQLVLRQIKQTLHTKGVEKQDIVLMLDDQVDYQTLITLLDTSRSYKDVVAASVVDAELFPEVSFADAPAELLAKDIDGLANSIARQEWQ